MKPFLLLVFSFSILYVASSLDANSVCYDGSEIGLGKQKSITVKYRSIFIERFLLAAIRSGKETKGQVALSVVN
jgi:hypothetical protein